MSEPTRPELARTGFRIAYLTAMIAMLTGATEALPHGLFRALRLFLILPAGIVCLAMILIGNRGWRR